MQDVMQAQAPQLRGRVIWLEHGQGRWGWVESFMTDRFGNNIGIIHKVFIHQDDCPRGVPLVGMMNIWFRPVLDEKRGGDARRAADIELCDMDEQVPSARAALEALLKAA